MNTSTLEISIDKTNAPTISGSFKPLYGSLFLQGKRDEKDTFDQKVAAQDAKELHKVCLNSTFLE